MFVKTVIATVIDKLISYCLNSNYNDIEISCENIQLNEWKETLSFHLYPREKYSMYYFNFYRYIDKLKSGISLNTLKNDTYFMKNYKRLKLNDLIAKLEKLYSDDKPESKTTKNSFVNNDYKKTEAILNILLDGDIDFIIHNGRYQFSQTSVETLNFLLNKHFDNEDMDYNDELMERFKKELKKGNIKSFDSIFSNKNKENNEDPYYLFKDIFLPEIHSLIADLYDINTNCHFSDINTTLTYELLTHKTYNKLVNEFNLLYDDILNYHSTNIASVHVTRIIQHRFSPILNMIKEFPAVFIIPEEPKDVEITYDIIKSVLTSFKKVYNIDLIKNESCTMEYLQRLTENIIDLRALLNLTNAKGTA